MDVYGGEVIEPNGDKDVRLTLGDHRRRKIVEMGRRICQAGELLLGGPPGVVSHSLRGAARFKNFPGNPLGIGPPNVIGDDYASAASSHELRRQFAEPA